MPGPHNREWLDPEGANVLRGYKTMKIIEKLLLLLIYSGLLFIAYVAYKIGMVR